MVNLFQNKHSNISCVTRAFMALIIVLTVSSTSGTALFAHPSSALAQAEGSGESSAEGGSGGDSEEGDSGGGSVVGDAAEGAAVGAAGCAIAGFLGGAIDSGLESLGESFDFDISSIFGGDMVPVDDIQHNQKECFIDGAAKAVATALLRSITFSVVSWINSGFDGSPAFIQDLEGFLGGVADQVIGEYIYGSELGFLCSPFELNVRLTLALQYQEYTNPVECTLSEAVGNAEGSIDEFFGGDFSAGGFPRWIETFAFPQNNPYGAASQAAAELDVRVADAQHRAEVEANFGDGFLSFKECAPIEGSGEVEAGTGAQAGEFEAGTGAIASGENCRIVTPGQIISDHLTFELQTDQLQLIEADEVNESINAIANALARQAFKEGVGLVNADLDEYEESAQESEDEDTEESEESGPPEGGGGPGAP